jgi:ribose transport system ATP-binding protein
MPTSPLLTMHGIAKSYPGVRALAGVDLALHPGEVLALLGENGAGKSTLIKILAGAIAPDAGAIHLQGAAVDIRNPLDAQRAGIAVIYQELNLVPGLSARANIFLGQERTRAGFLRRGEERRQARLLLERLGAAVNPETPCRLLSVAQQQAVEIAKALSLDARILVLDEPSAPLTPPEVAALFAVIRDLKRQGLGIIYISHRLDEVFQIADRIMVLRDGRHVRTCATGEVNRQQLIEMMVGRTIETEFPRRQSVVGEPRLVARGLRRGSKVRDVSLTIHRGEVLALTGLVGAGRTETARLLFGADRAEAGSIELDGKALVLREPRDAIRAGICLLTEDRKNQGLILGQSVLDNFGLPSLPMLTRFGFVQRRRQRDAFTQFAEQLRIKVPGPHVPAGNLSGGNQQKVVLARWLHANSEVLIFDEPTRGIDVGAKYEIYLLMNELAARGKAILMISSELPEVLGMADRILVMHDGRITGAIDDVRSATQEQILNLAVR